MQAVQNENVAPNNVGVHLAKKTAIGPSQKKKPLGERRVNQFHFESEFKSIGEHKTISLQTFLLPSTFQTRPPPRISHLPLPS